MRCLWLPLAALIYFTGAVLAHAEVISFALEDNLIRVPTVVDEHPASGVLDTGTGGIGLDRVFAASNRIEAGHKLDDAIGAGLASQSLNAATVSSLLVGGVRLLHPSAFLLDASPLSGSAGFPIDVLIGKQFFEHRIVDIDYPGRQIRTGADARGLDCAAPVPLDLSFGVPIVTVQATLRRGGPSRTLRLLIDTGTRHHAVILEDAFLDEADKAFLTPTPASRQVGQGIGGPVMGWLTTLPDLRIGILNYREIKMAINHSTRSVNHHPIDGTLGVPFLRQGRISLDYDRKLACLPNR